MNIAAFRRHLEWAEGRRKFPYEDSVGKLTIGIGRNLEDRGLSDDEIDMLCNNDIRVVLDSAETLPYWSSLDEVRQIVVCDMIYNLGINRFLGFIKTNEAIAAGNFALAADEMMDSRWARQVGRRAVRLSEAMRSGVWKEGP